jgi:hypothetical protein
MMSPPSTLTFQEVKTPYDEYKIREDTASINSEQASTVYPICQGGEEPEERAASAAIHC